ncbi:MAG: acetate uptake transporter [Desulfobacterales bacterium]
MSEAKLGNPAVVGLGGFGMTTLILQFHNLGWVGIGPVLWLGLLFGGSAQLIAGLMEFKTGNNFGFCAFTGYGAFWISLCFYLIFGTNKELINVYPVLKLTGPDLGWFLVVWTIFTGILFIAAMKHHGTLAWIFLTLFLGPAARFWARSLPGILSSVLCWPGILWPMWFLQRPVLICRWVNPGSRARAAASLIGSNWHRI